MKSLLIGIAAVLVIAPGLSTGAPADGIDALDAYRGLYRVSPQQIIGIDSFIADDGTPTLLYSDYRSGVVRRMHRMQDAVFVVGPGFNVASPAEITVAFREQNGAITSVTLESADGTGATAARIPLTEQQVTFENGDAKLAGTLIIPEGTKPRAAIALLHGSGPLTRRSFGPYPLFFAAQGFAVLTYDKRGTGASTGMRVDASTGRVMAPLFYPDDLRNDALAALALLRAHPAVDATKVGFWGSSEGGMLATQAAAHSADVAFAINSSGFMGPLWETTLYQAAALPRQNGAAEADIDESVAFTRQWLAVAQTGEGWDAFVARREQIRAKSPRTLFWSSGQFASVDEMRWYWDHVLSFSPLPALKNVKASVLGVFGGSDPLTDAPVAAENLRRSLVEAGNSDVTIKIFPGAGHSLNVDSGARMAPGVFDTLRQWLAAKVQPAVIR